MRFIKKLVNCLIIITVVTIFNTPLSLAETYDTIAYPSNAAVKVNGRDVTLNAYNIYDTNYFRLRDIAMAMNGSSKQFQVEYDLRYDAIMVTTKTPYTPIGGELSASTKNTKVNPNRLYNVNMTCDNVELTSYSCYKIDDSNYFSLRDIAYMIDFGILYDASTNTINIDTEQTYSSSLDIAYPKLGQLHKLYPSAYYLRGAFPHTALFYVTPDNNRMIFTRMYDILYNLSGKCVTDNDISIMEDALSIFISSPNLVINQMKTAISGIEYTFEIDNATVTLKKQGQLVNIYIRYDTIN